MKKRQFTVLTLLLFIVLLNVRAQQTFVNPSLQKSTTTTHKPVSPLREVLLEKLKTKDKIKLDLFVMSQCPFGVRAEETLLPLVSELGERVEFKLHFVGWLDQNQRIESMHGQTEVDENFRQVVIAKLYPALLTRYLLARAKNYQSNDWKSVAQPLGILPQVVEETMASAEGQQWLLEAIRPSMEQKIYASPTVLLDGEKYRGKIMPLSTTGAANEAQCNTPPSTAAKTADAQCSGKPDGSSCNDGNPCTQTDACESGVCIGKNPKTCDDSNACTTDVCDRATGACVNTPKICSDNSECTVDACNPANGQCVFTLIQCDDNNPNTMWAGCDASTGCYYNISCQAYPNNIAYVNAAAMGSNLGNSWANAFTDLQNALFAAKNCGVTQIWVAKGTYKPTQSNDPTIAFEMVNGVAIYGGFDGIETQLLERNWQTNVTTLSGDIGTSNSDDNSYSVINNNNNGLTATAILDGFTITGVSSTNPDAGAMRNISSSPTIRNCTFIGNTALFGGGMQIRNASPNIINCVFQSNIAKGPTNSGGAIYIQGSTSSPQITNCRFIGNLGFGFGGAVSVSGGTPTFNSCIFLGNKSSMKGGGCSLISDGTTQPIFNNCSFSGNEGRALWVSVDVSTTLKNCIFWGNDGEIVNENGTVAASYCIVQQGSGVYPGIGNLNVNPLFISQPSIGLGTTGDLRLQGCSLAIDAGTNQGIPTTDLEGNARVNAIGGGGTVDIGAYEYQGVLSTTARWYVNAAIGTPGNGTSWNCAFKDLQSALAVASSGDEIWVAAGTYKPNADLYGNTSPANSRTKTFVMKNGVKIYGSFLGVETALSERTFAVMVANKSILSGDLNDDDATTGNAENSYHVIYNNDNGLTTANSLLDGFTITGGNANGGGENSNGGGMHNKKSSPSLVNCIFSGNVGGFGGGMHNNDYASPSLINCTFSGNYSNVTGSGMDNSNNSSPSLVNCVFSGNQANDNGGGMHNYDSCSPSLVNCSFRGNQTGTVGGGMCNIKNSSPSLVNCVFSGNRANDNGGGMYNQQSSPSYVNCSFAGNQANRYGGAICNNLLAAPSFKNCILWGNSSEVENFNNSVPSYTKTLVKGMIIGGFQGTEDPLFVNQPAVGVGTAGDLRLWPCSPAINVGNDADNTVTTDLVANNRKVSTIDLGAYEYQSSSSVAITPTLDTTNPSTCGGSDGSIGLSGFLNNATYSVSYKKNNVAVSAANFTSNGSGAITLTGLGAGSYTDIVATYGACVSNAVTASLEAPVPPTATIASNNSPICSGNNATFSINGTTGATLTYTLTGLMGNQTLLLDGTNQAIVANNATSDVTLTLVSVTKNSCLVSLNATSTVTVNPLPTATIASNNSPICSGNNATFSVNGTNGATLTYTLTGLVGNQTLLLDGTNQTITANNVTSDVTLTLVSVTKNNCLVSLNATSTVTVNLLPTATIASNNSPICSGNNATFSVNGTTGATLTYTLTGLTGNQTLLLDGTNQAITANNATADVTLTLVSVTKNNCLVSLNSPSTVTVNPLPTATIVSSNSPICSGNNATFSVNGTTGATLTYTLTGLMGNQTLLLDGTNQAIVANNATADVTLTLVSVTKNNCLVSLNATSTVTVNPLPTATIVSSNSPICAGNNATFSVNGTTGATLTYTLTGLTGNQTLLLDGTTQTITANNATSEVTLTLVSVTKNNCLVSLNVTSTVTVNPLPTATIASSNSPICSGNNATFSVNGTTGATLTYTLTGLTGNQTLLLDGTNQAIVANNATADVTLTLVSVTKNNCLVSLNATSTVTVNPLPTAMITGTTTVCQNATSPKITFTGAGGTTPYTFTYKINNGSEQTIVTTSGNSVSLDAPTGQVGIVEYNLVRVKDGSSTLCSQTTQTGGVTVTVQGKPTITLSTLQQTLNEGNSQVLCDTDANPVNGLQFTVSGSCVVGNPVWRVQVGSGGWSEWSANAPVSQSSNNQPHRYQAACDASCPVTYTNPIELTINYRSSTPQNVSLVADGVSVTVGETKEVCNIEGNAITFNATCGLGEVLLYSVDGAEYSSTLPVQLVDGQYHNYRVRCRKSDGTVSCVETESGVMRLRIVSSSLVAPVASLNVTSGCGSPVTFSGTANCGALTTIWYNAVTNLALPSLPNQTPTETTSYYARCQAGGGCLSEKSNVVTYTVIPVGVAPVITVSQDIVCTGTTVKISANCPAGSQTFWNTGVTASSFEVAFSNVTKQTYWAKCVFSGGCQSAESVRKDVYWNAFVVTLINIGESKSAIKTNDRAAWSSQFITRDGGPELEQSTQVNPTLYFVENANKMAPRYWTINVEACGLSTDGSLTFDMLATPEMGVIRSFNTHENNAPYFMYANREGWTELYAQNHPAYGFYQDNGAGGNIYDAGLPKGLYKLGIRYWDQKGWGSIYPSTRKAQGNVLAYQEYWFRIQSKDGVGVGAAREGANGSGQVAKGKEQGASVQEARGEEGVFATVLPNPVTHTLRLKVQDSKGQVVQAALTDAAGREVLSRQFVPVTNTHQEEFGVSALPTGMYFLKVTTSEKQATLKVVKME
ncbi:choice-of-anchor Q domain-containing protein [Runella sp. SP2]|uniref:choice-of-anchor Q domain-containing protein n=1 Tax=Runella sp. SP2 TaxID=2268026 RepID=UPI0013DDEC3C|nr:choice-of-anchor Q domain-containing protein [Runella sp. SP2]